jgi:hypothetical protein
LDGNSRFNLGKDQTTLSTYLRDRTLADIADARACLDLVAALEDPNFGVRWLAAEGLISIGRNALRPLMKALTKRSGSAWLREGAHHVLHDLAGKDLEVEDLVRPVIAGLEGIEPEIGGMEAAYAALHQLKVSIEKGQTSEVES